MANTNAKRLVGLTGLALDETLAMISQDQLYCKKKGWKQGDTFHQPHGAAITVRTRTVVSHGQVSDNHGQLFRHILVTIFAIILSYSLDVRPLFFGLSILA